MMPIPISRILLRLAALTLLVLATGAQGRLVLDQVHGFSLEETVTGENPDRTVAVYLPPSYDGSPEQRYPVLYLLHGIGGTHADWTTAWAGGPQWGTIQGVMDRGIASGNLAEMIVVMPDQRTRGGGSFYTNSAATGNWEDFTVVDLVDHVDTTYRTHARAASRGIAGHSMGGYGALKLGMKHPDVYQVVYGIAAALLAFDADLSIENQGYAAAAKATPASLNPQAEFWPASILCVAQAFSPNVDNPPFYADLPFVLVDGVLQKSEETYARWEANMPLNMVDDHVAQLRELRGLRFDAGWYEEFTHIPPTNRALSDRLTELGIPHVYEEFNGDHRNRLWGPEGRVYTEILPYFSRLLEAE